MTIPTRSMLLGSTTCLLTIALSVTAQETPKITKETIARSPRVSTEQLKGTVAFVEGRKLAVQLSTGDFGYFDVPESRRFIVDGKELTVEPLQPGTTLTATITTTHTPVTDRTTTVGTAKVWYVSGNTVILTLPNNENRTYKVNDSYRFIVNGEKASVHDLRKDMVISAEKIVEQPRTEIASNIVVIGQSRPKP